MMTDLLSRLLSIATLVFAVSSMLSVGFSYTVRELVEPLRNARLVIGALVANFVLVPLLAYAITGFLSLGQARDIGLILVATAAGAPFLIKLTQAADGDLAIAAALLVLLLVVTMGYMPIVVPLIAPGAEVSASSIAMPLVLTMLLPLAIGLFVDAKFERWADRLQPLMNKMSTAALVVLFVSTILTNFGRILDVFGTGAILAALLFIAGAFGIGYLLGMTGRGTREELGLATAQRNIAAATVVATQSFGDPDTLVMVVVTSLVAMVLLFPIAGALGKRQEKLAAAGGRRVSARHKAPLV
jgi:BASS family bile acid:Na+ symporter